MVRRAGAVLLSFLCAATASAEPPPALECPGTHRAVVLTGGGIRGAYQAGALWYLVNVLGCEFHHYVGTSTGAINAALLAQAKDKEDLKRRVDLIVNDYLELEHAGQLADEHFLGGVRLFLPRWLGGVDGMMTLRPVEQRLRLHIDPANPRTDNLSIGVVSLQTGRLHPGSHEPASLVDFVIGSASIPLAVEPRRARLFGRAAIEDFDGQELVLFAPDAPGLRDPDCEVRLRGVGVLKCQQIGVDFGEATYDFRVRLRLPQLTEADRRTIFELAKKKRTYDEQSDACDYDARFTTIHELVDGGVTENSPVQMALDVPSYACKGLDTFFVIHTGSSARIEAPLSPSSYRGGRRIGARSLDYAWESYQDKAEYFDSYSVLLPHVACQIRELLERRGRSGIPVERELEEFARDSQASAQFCSSLPLILKLKPWAGWFTETFEVDRVKIRMALHHGCLMGSRVGLAPRGQKHGFVELPIPRPKEREAAACDELLIRGTQADG
jgi:predicted acylesterase/phospholipase RssA